MPVTPFHFGPGLLGKRLAPRWWSWTAFAVVNVVIDVESLYHLVRGEWPVHRGLHAFVGAALVAIATTIVLIAIARALRGPLAKITSPIWHAEVGIMHSDIPARRCTTRTSRRMNDGCHLE